MDLGFFFMLPIWEVFVLEIDLGLQILNFHFGLSKIQMKIWIWMDLYKSPKSTWKGEVTFFHLRFWHGSKLFP